MDIDKEINRIAFDIRAFEHASEEEMKNYLKEHPNADPKDHWVKRKTIKDRVLDVVDSVRQFGENVKQKVSPNDTVKTYKQIKAIPLSKESETAYYNSYYDGVTDSLSQAHFDSGFSLAKHFGKLVQRIVSSKNLLREFKEKGHYGVTEEERDNLGLEISKERVYIQAATKAFRDFAKNNPQQFKTLIDTYKSEREKHPDIFGFKQDSGRVTSPYMR